jgi:catechol 2,3-dioxygenase-like lactoylglutathione lyase family enzyme
MPIAHSPSVVLDCDDPRRLADFYGALLGWRPSADDGWGEVRSEAGDQCICFQRVDHYRPPQWPGQDVPQQMHIDVMVDDLDAGERAVLELGATRTEHQPGTTFRVFLDPSGHPFCLCVE